MATIKFEGTGTLDVQIPDAALALPRVVYLDRPVEKIVYVDKPVYMEVERTVYVDRPVYRDVEKRVYIDRPTPPQVIHRVHYVGPLGWIMFAIALMFIMFLVFTDNPFTVRRTSFDNQVTAAQSIYPQLQLLEQQRQTNIDSYWAEREAHNRTKGQLFDASQTIAERDQMNDALRAELELAKWQPAPVNITISFADLPQYSSMTPINTRWLGSFSESAWANSLFTNMGVTVLQTPTLDAPGIIRYSSADGYAYYWTWNDPGAVVTDEGTTLVTGFHVVDSANFDPNTGYLTQLTLRYTTP